MWAEGEAGVGKVGLRAARFNPATGYSFPDAVRTADLVAGLPDLSPVALDRALRDAAVKAWDGRSLFRLLNKLLFLAAYPYERRQILERFYRLDARLIGRFYASESTFYDRMRILTGKPPIPIPRGRPRPPQVRVRQMSTVLPAAPTGAVETPKFRTACVIGAGFGGLALAIRLQSAGVQTTLIESRDKPGGRAYVFEDQGFVFDAGPTVITDPSCLEELWELSGRKLSDYVELLPVTPFYRLLWEDGTVFDYSNDDEALFAQIAAKSPRDVEGYKKFLEYSEGVFREGYEKLGHEAFLDFKSMLKAAPSLMKYQAFRSVYSIVAKYIKDDQLRQAFSFHSLLVGGNPFKTSSIYALIHALEKKWGVWFPRGGTNALVKGMVRLFEDLGGTVKIGSGVEQITADGVRVTGVRTRDGWSGTFDTVASNADVVHTYEALLAEHPRGKAMARSMKRRSFSPSLFVTYFGLKRQHPDVRHHSILFGHRYKELLSDIYGGGELAEDFSLYLHHPTATDPAMAPPGCSAFYVLSPVPASRQARYRLGCGGAEIREHDPGRARASDPAGVEGRPGDDADLHAQGLLDRAQRASGVGVQPRAGAVAVGVFPDAQPG